MKLSIPLPWNSPLVPILRQINAIPPLPLYLCKIYFNFFSLSLGATAPSGPWPPHSRGLFFSRSHTATHHSRQDSSGRVISSSQRPLADNTQHSQQTDLHAPGGIRSHNLGRRAAVDLRLRPRGHWDRHLF